jgi:phosphoribosyl 1,2-cyclic phosphodiesterase/ActR/RegA family two-component response regulator
VTTIMQKKIHFFIIDDDKSALHIYENLLKKAGHKVTTTSTSQTAIDEIISSKPDCVLCDLSMPGVDGMDLFQSIRALKNIEQPTFIIITGKVFEYDHRRALEMGVDGYINKPINPESFLEEITAAHEGKMLVHFWGSRGTLPVPGENTIKFGGNTNCVTLSIGTSYFFIFDAGTGIKSLSNHLIKENKFPLNAKIFISHPHYDHINGIPFFVPLYMHGNHFEIFGTRHSGIGIEKLLADQMDSVYFPITMKEFGAKISFRDLSEETFKIDNIEISTILLNHPGKCLGYRIQYKNKAFCYITDNELYLEDSPNYNQFDVDQLIAFMKDADVCVIDATYTDEDYLRKTGWGHSGVSRVVDVADKANVKLLCLYHHDPDEFDKEIAAKLKFAKDLLKKRRSKTVCCASNEGSEILI